MSSKAPKKTLKRDAFTERQHAFRSMTTEKADKTLAAASPPVPDWWLSKKEKIKDIGRGSSGVVELWQGKLSPFEKSVCKRVNIKDLSLPDHEKALCEVMYLRSCVHPSIVTYKTHWVDNLKSELVIAQEYVDGGDLATLISTLRKNKRQLLQDWIVSWSAQLIHALCFIHTEFHILHRDIKPGNIFVTKDLSLVKLGDFGISRTLDSTLAQAMTVIGTPQYLSPEVEEKFDEHQNLLQN